MGAVPETVARRHKDIYRYLPPGDSAGRADVLSIELATAPVEIIGQALAYLPSESPARSVGAADIAAPGSRLTLFRTRRGTGRPDMLLSSCLVVA